MNEAVDALSMASKNLHGEELTDASTIKDTVKLAVGVTCSILLAKYTQDKKWIPNDPFKTA